MTTTTRRATLVVALSFIVFGTMPSATRFAASADDTDRPLAPTPPAATTAATEIAATTEKARDAADGKRTVVLEGRVLGPNDRPVAGARLFLNVDEWTESVALGKSGDDGHYRFEIPQQQLRRTVASDAMHVQCQASLIAVAEGLGARWQLLPDVDGGRRFPAGCSTPRQTARLPVT